MCDQCGVSIPALGRHVGSYLAVGPILYRPVSISATIMPSYANLLIQDGRDLYRCYVRLHARFPRSPAKVGRGQMVVVNVQISFFSSA